MTTLPVLVLPLPVPVYVPREGGPTLRSDEKSAGPPSASSGLNRRPTL